MQADPEMYTMKQGMKAPSFTLWGVDDKQYKLENFAGKKALVIVFMCNHCPYVIAYVERIKQVEEQFRKEKVQFIAINANDPIKYPQDSFEHMKRFLEEKGIVFPYLYDETQEVAKAYGALLTPHVFLFDEHRKLAYQGGIDNNWERKEKASKYFLTDALNAVVKGQIPLQAQAPCIGCSIKWK